MAETTLLGNSCGEPLNAEGGQGQALQDTRASRENKSVWSLAPQESISLVHPYWLSVEDPVNPKKFPALWARVQSP